MGISRITYWMIQGNDVRIVDTPERCEAWSMKAGFPHALLLSCPHERKADLEKAIADIKADASLPA